jgi:hypothetical protein
MGRPVSADQFIGLAACEPATRPSEGGLFGTCAAETTSRACAIWNSIDDCLQHFDEVMGTEDIYIPPDTVHEILYECEQIGLDLDAVQSVGSNT